MCFSIHPDHKSVKIAGKDITCWKYFTSVDKFGGTSFWQQHRYYFGTQENIADPFWPKFINSTSISEGFHSWSSYKPTLDYCYCDRIIKCKIPKGSEYFYNPTNKEYISNQIIIVKKVSKLENSIRGFIVNPRKLF